jgi:hypothetical protein
MLDLFAPEGYKFDVRKCSGDQDFCDRFLKDEAKEGYQLIDRKVLKKKGHCEVTVHKLIRADYVEPECEYSPTYKHVLIHEKGLSGPICRFCGHMFMSAKIG